MTAIEFLRKHKILSPNGTSWVMKFTDREVELTGLFELFLVENMPKEVDPAIANAAAPELLQALEAAQEYWERGNQALVDQCRAAIAKATNQTT